MHTDTNTDAPTAAATPRVLHLLQDESARYRRAARTKPTWCRQWVGSRELATHVDEVTCPACRAQFEHYTNLEV